MPRTKSIVILVLLSVLAGGFGFAARADYRQDFSKSLPLKAGGVFALDNVNGEVNITTWKESRVEIKALKIAKKSEKDLADVEIRVEGSENSVTVKTIWPRNREDFQVSVKFDVRVPEGAVLKKVETVNGDVKASGVFASAELETTNGMVTADGTKGPIDVETTNGEIHVRGAEGKVKAETTNGEIELEGLVFKDAVWAETTNGSIRLVIQSPDKINADLEAETTNGTVSVDFPITIDNMRGDKREIKARLGQGGPQIHLTTTNGEIEITKH